MTAELSELVFPTGGWTTDDLDALPESHRRYELIDGALVMSPAPTHLHQYIAMTLGSVLIESCPSDYAVSQSIEIRVDKRRSFLPDVLAFTAEASRRNPSKLHPHEILLAVEIVSPGSVTMDRVTKPALYAQAGIPHYWRVETDGRVAVHTHRLDTETPVYVPTGEYPDVVTVSEPWPMTIPLSRVIPR